MKKFLVLGFVVFASLFLAIGCDDDKDDEYDCWSYCKDWEDDGYESKSHCITDCKKQHNIENSLNKYILECINAGHSETDCETWYYED